MNRRLDIIKRAAEVFARKGVAQTSMEDIASAVGIKREGVYYYFKNRDVILLEIILPQSRSLLSGLERIIDGSGSPHDKLRAAIEHHLGAYNPNYLEMSITLRESLIVQNGERFSELKEIWDRYDRLFSELIAAGQKSGDFNAELNPRMVAFAVLGMCNWVSRWYSPGGRLTIADIARTFSTFAISGITPPGPSVN